MNTSDLQLVERLLRGERGAFDAFFNEFYPKLYRFVKRRMPHDAAGAEDIAQATLCRALESLRGYRGEAALMTWLCTLCRREMSARWEESRQWRSAPRLAEDDPAVRAALESLLASEQIDPLRAADREQVRESILAALDYLPAPYGDILEWKYLRDMSMDEIARRLGRSQKAVESLLTRARESFREAFTLLSGAGAGGELT
jgi:RNA polymerase sigma-70 factor, ECF subfamily